MNRFMTLVAALPAFAPAETFSEVRADDIADESPGLLKTTLPDHYHEIYLARTRGERVGVLAERYKCDRTTIWRRIKAVQDEFALALEKSSAFNIVSEIYARLISLEQENRLAASTEKSGRAKSMLLKNCQSCLVAQADLLMSVGILEKTPEKIYRITQTPKPIDSQELESKQSNRTREEIVSELIDRLGRATQL